MLMEGTANVQCRQKGEYVSLKESDEQFQQADSETHHDTQNGNGSPKPRRTTGGGDDERQEHRQHDVPGKQVRPKSNGQDTVLDKKRENFNAK